MPLWEASSSCQNNKPAEEKNIKHLSRITRIPFFPKVFNIPPVDEGLYLSRLWFYFSHYIPGMLDPKIYIVACIVVLKLKILTMGPPTHECLNV